MSYAAWVSEARIPNRNRMSAIPAVRAALVVLRQIDEHSHTKQPPCLEGGNRLRKAFGVRRIPALFIDVCLATAVELSPIQSAGIRRTPNACECHYLLIVADLNRYKCFQRPSFHAGISSASLADCAR